MRHDPVVSVGAILLVMALTAGQWGCGEGQTLGTVEVPMGSLQINHGKAHTRVTKDKTSPVKLEDSIVTSTESAASIRAGPQTHTLQETTELKLDAVSPDGAAAGIGAVTLVQGGATFSLPKADDPANKPFKFQVSAGGVVIATKGGSFKVELTGSDAKISVQSGEVDTLPRKSDTFRAFGQTKFKHSLGILKEGQSGTFRDGKLQIGQ